ncbi:28S ribosomal protein S35, mitochondrial-like [Octopus sinensis]|uniref:28S ribosomal protein S35, mitochondrial-like n=1 Tax=Octopus sinensis TaxID=2607531 RepID=A0A7E6EJU1_9MOLL|nr:28S ribosomal protein S35, mitochondrial-like [Octopus sinensis]
MGAPSKLGDRTLPTYRETTEMLKIPNFFHLTPKHIQKQCEKLKGRCPTRKQNYEYLKYVLVVLYMESLVRVLSLWQKRDTWESECAFEDRETFEWADSPSARQMGKYKQVVDRVFTLLLQQKVDQSVEEMYSGAVTALHNDGESPLTLENYRKAVELLYTSIQN